MDIFEHWSIPTFNPKFRYRKITTYKNNDNYVSWSADDNVITYSCQAGSRICEALMLANFARSNPRI